jgi:hypothetical protein
MMTKPFLGLLTSASFLLSSQFIWAAQLAYEPFGYTPGSTLTSQAGGSGWTGAWTQDPSPIQSCVVGAAGLTYTDSLSNILNVSGQRADTTGTATTRSFRTVANGVKTNVWISFLYQLPVSNNKFEGVSFYRGTSATAVFSVNNPSADTTTARITLTSNLSGGPSVNTQKGTFGTTHFIVLRLTEAGGTGGTDRVEIFVDRPLAAVPTAADGTIDGANFDFDIIRLAGQDGATLRVDELRIGDTYADVTPYTTVADPDGDGLTNAQEAELGLNPAVSDAALIAAIKSNPDFFDLYDAADILALGRGGVVLAQTGNDPVNLTLEVQQSSNLAQWRGLQTFNRNVTPPAGKGFVRVNIEKTP